MAAGHGPRHFTRTLHVSESSRKMQPMKIRGGMCVCSLVYVLILIVNLSHLMPQALMLQKVRAALLLVAMPFVAAGVALGWLRSSTRLETWWCVKNTLSLATFCVDTCPMRQIGGGRHAWEVAQNRCRQGAAGAGERRLRCFMVDGSSPRSRGSKCVKAVSVVRTSCLFVSQCLFVLVVFFFIAASQLRKRSAPWSGASVCSAAWLLDVVAVSVASPPLHTSARNN